MRRRDKTGGEAAKSQRPKTLKRRNAPKTARRRNPSAIDATERIELLTRERAEALEREAATAEVLKVISRSTFDLKAVLETLVQSAGKLCQAENVQIFLRDCEFYRLAADNGFSPEYQQYVESTRSGRGEARWWHERRWVSSQFKYRIDLLIPNTPIMKVATSADTDNAWCSAGPRWKLYWRYCFDALKGAPVHRQTD